MRRAFYQEDIWWQRYSCVQILLDIIDKLLIMINYCIAPFSLILKWHDKLRV